MIVCRVVLSVHVCLLERGWVGDVKVSVILSIFCSRYSGFVALRSKNDKTQKKYNEHV